MPKEKMEIHVTFNKTEINRFIRALDNYPNFGKNNVKRLRDKFYYDEGNGHFSLNEYDLTTIFKIASYAGSLKIPARRPKKKAYYDSLRAAKKRVA